MQPMPRLNPDEVRVLQVILDRSIVQGRALMRTSGISEIDKFMAIAINLLKHELIETSGNIFDEDQILNAMFRVMPSVAPYVKQTIYQSYEGLEK